MKSYVAYIGFVSLLLLPIVSGCRTNNTSQKTHVAERLIGVDGSASSTAQDSTRYMEANTKTNELSASTQAQSKELSEENKKSNEYQDEYEREYEFDTDGKLTNIKEKGRRTGRAESQTGRRGSSHVSNTTRNAMAKEEANIQSDSGSDRENKVDIKVVSQEKSNTMVTENNINDSRPVQSSEWLYITIPLTIVGLLYILIRWKWRK